MKTCSKCGEWLPLSKFNKDKFRRGGLHPWCKGCRAKYRQEHRTKIVEYNKEYRQGIKGYLRGRFDNMPRRCDNLNDKDYIHYGGKGIKCLFTFSEFFIHVTVDLGFDTIEKLIDLEIHRTKKHYEVGGIEFLTAKEHHARHKEMENKK